MPSVNGTIRMSAMNCNGRRAPRCVGTLLSALALGIAAFSAAAPRPSARLSPPVLRAAAVTALPVIDGTVDPMWQRAPEVVLPVAGGANTAYTEVALRAVYTRDAIAFLARWDDPTESLAYETWVKQPDGSWKQQMRGEPGDVIGGYEDKFALAWSIDNSVAGFERMGCAAACHAGEIKRFGLKHTAREGEKVDVWHWKAARTNPVGQIDDQYVDHTRYDAQTTPDAGRKPDPNTGGGYRPNKDPEGRAPAFMPPGPAASPFWVLDADKQPFRDTFRSGDRIGSILIAPFQGDRGEIRAKGIHRDGRWTLEWTRALDTGSAFDVQFRDRNQRYPFGVAVFDDAGTRHSFLAGAAWLQFERAPR
jgi:hypothetical protein